jgi:isocitrate dehydrogenase
VSPDPTAEVGCGDRNSLGTTLQRSPTDATITLPDVPDTSPPTPAPIIYTLTDEAPMLATHSLLPIIQAYAGVAGVPVEARDISLGGRILAVFPERLTDEQRQGDALTELGELALQPDANIIKLPNISASIPQLKAAIGELQTKGYDIPSYPDDPGTDEERDARARYDRVKGSAVNPVLREGNSDRRASHSVKEYARRHPHSMGAWSPDSKTNVAHMAGDDFRSNERSVVVEGDGSLRIELVARDGSTTVLRESVPVLAGEVVDATVMRVAPLRAFLDEQVVRAKAEDVLFSVHVKATMMKVSDPIIFGHVVQAFLPQLFEQYGDVLAAADISPNDGLGHLLTASAALPEGEQIKAAVDAALDAGPRLSMVDSDRGITNLHVPSDVIVDASMPAMIRNSGHMWGPDGEEDDTLAVIPESSYAGIYQVIIDDCRAHGAFDPATMGSVPNVGLMAQAAEEYGSHDKTFEVPVDGRVRVVDADGNVLLEHEVSAGDIWRACQTKDVPIRDWVKLAVTRARATGSPAVFWLDETRAHDAVLIAKVNAYLPDHDTDGLDIRIMAPEDAMAFSLERIRRGDDTIAVTGNVLRDYLTDLFPIMELGTSAKMLSVVPLINGGGLFETGAGGSAPKHVQQLLRDNYLRWDSLGEFLALAVSFEHFAGVHGNERAQILADTLDRATETFLEENKSPTRRVGGIDNRGSHFYLALYWAQELARQSDDPELAAAFEALAKTLAENEKQIAGELLAVQGSPADIGGYYRPDPDKTNAVMRPSPTFNDALAQL